MFNRFSSVSPTSSAFVWRDCHGTSHWKLLDGMWKDAVVTQFHCLEGTEEQHGAPESGTRELPNTSTMAPV